MAYSWKARGLLPSLENKKIRKTGEEGVKSKAFFWWMTWAESKSREWKERKITHRITQTNTHTRPNCLTQPNFRWSLQLAPGLTWNNMYGIVKGYHQVVNTAFRAILENEPGASQRRAISSDNVTGTSFKLWYTELMLDVHSMEFEWTFIMSFMRQIEYHCHMPSSS